MAELRKKAESEDYLAYICSALRGEIFNDMVLKIQKVDWQEVGKRVLAEEKSMAERAARGLDHLPAP